MEDLNDIKENNDENSITKLEPLVLGTNDFEKITENSSVSKENTNRGKLKPQKKVRQRSSLSIYKKQTKAQEIGNKINEILTTNSEKNKNDNLSNNDNGSSAGLHKTGDTSNCKNEIVSVNEEDELLSNKTSKDKDISDLYKSPSPPRRKSELIHMQLLSKTDKIKSKKKKKGKNVDFSECQSPSKKNKRKKKRKIKFSEQLVTIIDVESYKKYNIENTCKDPYEEDNQDQVNLDCACTSVCAIF